MLKECETTHYGVFFIFVGGGNERKTRKNNGRKKDNLLSVI